MTRTRRPVNPSVPIALALAVAACGTPRVPPGAAETVAAGPAAADVVGPPATPDVVGAPATPDVVGAPATPDVVGAPAAAFDVRARLASGEPGCVGFSARTAKALVIATVGDGAKAERVVAVGDVIGARPTSLGSCNDPSPDACRARFAAAAEAVAASSAMRELLAGDSWLPCRPIAPGTTSVALGGRSFALSPDGTLVDHGYLDWASSGCAKTASCPTPTLIATYVATGLPEAFEVFRVKDDRGEDGMPERIDIVGLDEAALGLAAGCTPRPHGGDAPAPARAVDIAALTRSAGTCLFMTANGRAAAFALRDGVTWRGPGAPPDIDLGCIDGTCSAEELEALAAAVRRSGLVACREAEHSLILDGVELPAEPTRVSLEIDGRVRRWPPPSLPDEPTGTALLGAYQAPNGPVYVTATPEGPSGLADGPLQVLWYDESLFGFCSRPPGTPIEVPVQSVDGGPAVAGQHGFSFGAGNVVDGSLRSSWQPRVAVGAKLVLGLGAAAQVVGLEVGNGFQGVDDRDLDLFAANARVSQATLAFDDGSVEKVQLADARGLQRVTFAPHRSARIVMTIDAIVPGARWPKDVALSEVRVLAAP